MTPKSVETFPDSDPALVALLALAVADREQRLGGGREPQKTEVILDGAGLSLSEIALLTGRQYATVAKTRSRAKDRS